MAEVWVLRTVTSAWNPPGHGLTTRYVAAQAPVGLVAGGVVAAGVVTGGVVIRGVVAGGVDAGGVGVPLPSAPGTDRSALPQTVAILAYPPAVGWIPSARSADV